MAGNRTGLTEQEDAPGWGMEVTGTRVVAGGPERSGWPWVTGSRMSSVTCTPGAQTWARVSPPLLLFLREGPACTSSEPASQVSPAGLPAKDSPTSQEGPCPRTPDVDKAPEPPRWCSRWADLTSPPRCSLPNGTSKNYDAISDGAAHSMPPTDREAPDCAHNPALPSRTCCG